MRFGPFVALANVPVIFQFQVTTVYLVCHQYVMYEILVQCERSLYPTAHHTNSVLKMYTSLAKINEEFNSVNWVKVLVLAFCCISGLLTEAYRLGCVYFLGRDNIVMFQSRVSEFFFLQQLFIIMLLISYTGTMKESQRSSLLMKANLFMTEFKDEIRKQAKMLIMVLSQLPVYISAGFFHVNLSFLMSTCGILITYIVILMQFEMEYDGPTTVSSPLNITSK